MSGFRSRVRRDGSIEIFDLPRPAVVDLVRRELAPERPRRRLVRNGTGGYRTVLARPGSPLLAALRGVLAAVDQESCPDRREDLKRIAAAIEVALRG